jgi:hypothetical protein
MLGIALLLAHWRDPTCAIEVVGQPLPPPLTPADVTLENGDVAVGIIKGREAEIAAVKEHRRHCAERARGWLGMLDNV